MSEFTPGPWKLIPFGGPQIGNPATGEAICTMWPTDCMEANARLIAAAPELLSVLQVLVACEGSAWNPDRYAVERREALRRARAAIAAATGEG